MENQATDLSARLLATENLAVVRGSVPTASFDIKSRVLTLPTWKNMTPEIEDMLVGHEVGHALYTGEDYIAPIKANPKIKSYLNVLEDVRIEKLIKRKYPGLRKRMNEGYKQLNDRDFFGVSKTPLETLNLIDRINLYFKAGIQCGVVFDAEEKLFVKRAERTETIEEVIALAEEVYAFSKERAEQAQKERQEAGQVEETEDDQEYDTEYSDGFDSDENEEDEPKDEFDDFDQPPPGTTPKTPEEKAAEEVEEELESKTESAFQEKLEESADVDTKYVYHRMFKSKVDPVVGYKQVLKELSEDFDYENVATYYRRRAMGGMEMAEFETKLQTETVKFKADSTSSVNYLVKEFEMKKSAEMYKRAQTSKIGSLDMKKVWAYKLQDDLFKRVTTISEGKNHGMLFLLDWSGSMSEVIEDTLKQVINLAMFCNKAQIPYRVLAFTTQRRPSDHNRAVAYGEWETLRTESEKTGQSYLHAHYTGFHLLELFSNKMTSAEFNNMIRKVLDPRVFWRDNYDLGGTPLNEALLWVYHSIGDYMKTNRIEKMNFITLTDGQGNNLEATGGLNEWYYDQETSPYKRKKMVHMLRDETTKKSYRISRDAGQQTETLIKMIKDRYNVRTIGFYLCENKRRHLEQTIRDNVPGFNGNYGSTIDTMRKYFRDQGFYSLNGSGRDELFVVPVDSTKIKETSLEVNGDMTARKLANTLGKYMNVKKTSRVLLSRFIGLVA